MTTAIQNTPEPIEDRVVEAMARAMCIADGMDPDGEELADYEFTWQIFEGPARRQYRAWLAMQSVLLSMKPVQATQAPNLETEFAENEVSKKDLTDDWMNPRSTRQWTAPNLENKTVYAILRAKKEICFGNPGFIVKWEEWSKYDTAEARDEALNGLQEKHPMWQLKQRDYNPYLDSISTTIR